MLSLLSLVLLMQTQPDNQLQTIAESSNYTATASSAQVMELIDRIAKQSSIMRVSELGKTSEGKSIPLVFLANPPIGKPDVGVRTKPICFIMANIHAGEVEGKEASLMLIRELALNPDHPLLKDLTIIFAPNYNADGNDKFDTVEKNRPGQIGPAHCGIRANAEGMDLNRDYMKLEAPETRALVRFLNDWDPDITIDCHTTNGSQHRYALTYELPLNPSGHPAPIDFVRNELLPEVTKRVKDRTGYDMWFYGNFAKNHTIWETYSSQPRFGGPYQGLRNQMSVLSEAYSYEPFKDRVIVTREFIREILQFVAEIKPRVIELNQRARTETINKGRNPQPDDVIGLRFKIAAFNQLAIVKGYADDQGGEGGEAITDGHKHGPERDYSVAHLGRFESMLSVRRPFAYVIPPGFDTIIEKLKQHGIQTQPFKGKAMVETYTITKIDRATHSFQKHQNVQVDVDARISQRDMPSGSFIVPVAQALGTLAAYLLEPQSDDGLVAWNFFDEQLIIGKEFPVMRIQNPF